MSKSGNILRSRWLLFVGVLGLIVGLFIRVSASNKPHSISVEFVSLTNNPVSTLPSAKPRLVVVHGATNLCALFWFTNAHAASVWFETECAEQKVNGKWIECARPEGQWNGMEGGMWLKGSGCYYAIGWPPGLPTNATWRLQVRYGNDLSLFKSVMNYRFGAKFRPSQSFDLCSSGEVTP